MKLRGQLEPMKCYKKMMKEIEVTASKAQVHGTSKAWWRSQVAHVGCIQKDAANPSQSSLSSFAALITYLFCKVYQ